MLSLFKQRLDKILDEASLPAAHCDRVDTFAKIFALKRPQANAILVGRQPDKTLLEKNCL